MKDPAELPDVLTVRMAAEDMGVSLQQIRNDIASGALKGAWRASGAERRRQYRIPKPCYLEYRNGATGNQRSKGSKGKLRSKGSKIG